MPSSTQYVTRTAEAECEMCGRKRGICVPIIIVSPKSVVKRYRHLAGRRLMACACCRVSMPYGWRIAEDWQQRECPLSDHKTPENSGWERLTEPLTDEEIAAPLVFSASYGMSAAARITRGNAR